MSDLVAWLRAQLDEEERDIQQSRALSPTDLHWSMPDWLHRDRMLAEIEAKRRIIELHQVVAFEDEDMSDQGLGCQECGWSAEYADRGGWCETIRLLALPYADRPGYKEVWKP